jgi:hypothetical protein
MRDFTRRAFFITTFEKIANELQRFRLLRSVTHIEGVWPFAKEK